MNPRYSATIQTFKAHRVPSQILMPSSVRLHCTAQIVVSPSHGRQESHVSAEGVSGSLEKTGLPRSPIVRPGITDSQDRNAVGDVVVTMKAMHGCKRRRHGRQDERTTLRRKNLQRGYICDAWELLYFRGPGVARATWGMDGAGLIS